MESLLKVEDMMYGKTTDPDLLCFLSVSEEGWGSDLKREVKNPEHFFKKEQQMKELIFPQILQMFLNEATSPRRKHEFDICFSYTINWYPSMYYINIIYFFILGKQKKESENILHN